MVITLSCMKPKLAVIIIYVSCLQSMPKLIINGKRNKWPREEIIHQHIKISLHCYFVTDVRS